MTVPTRGLWAALFALALAVPACVPSGVIDAGAERSVADGAGFESSFYVGDDEVFRQRPVGPAGP